MFVVMRCWYLRSVVICVGVWLILGRNVMLVLVWVMMLVICCVLLVICVLLCYMLNESMLRLFLLLILGFGCVGGIGGLVFVFVIVRLMGFVRIV